MFAMGVCCSESQCQLCLAVRCTRGVRLDFDRRKRVSSDGTMGHRIKCQGLELAVDIFHLYGTNMLVEGTVLQFQVLAARVLTA